MTFDHMTSHFQVFLTIKVCHKSQPRLLSQNQSEGGSVSKNRIFRLVDLFAVKFKINLKKKDHSYSSLTTESGAMFCEL